LLSKYRRLFAEMDRARTDITALRADAGDDDGVLTEVDRLARKLALIEELWSGF
jgi:hypothetical protein